MRVSLVLTLYLVDIRMDIHQTHNIFSKHFLFNFNLKMYKENNVIIQITK